VNAPVTLPLWLAVALAAIAVWAVAGRILVPGVRWAIRTRVNRVLRELDTRLPVRIQPFKLTRRQVLVDRLTFDPEVQAEADRVAREEGAPREAIQARVRRYVEEIVPAFNAYVYFRIGYRIARAVARMLYRVRIGSVDQAGLDRIPADAAVVFVMNHRSNMDYVLVSYLAAERTALSYAVGEWARVFPLQTLIRAMGAYFVRRRSRNDLYRRVLQRYVAMATAEGVTQAVFPEGGLSRDGRLQPARLGLLDYMVRGFDPRAPRDVVFVPVGINYDRTLEDRTLLLDVVPDLPARHRGSAIAGTARFVGRNLWLAATGRWHRFGYACVNFGTPVSLREHLAVRGADPTALDRAARFRVVEGLAGRLMRAVGDLVPVLPVSVLATAFVADPEAGRTALEVKAAAHRVLRDVERGGGAVYIPRADREYAIEVGLRMLTLRRLVVERDGLYRAVPAELPVLRYYANSIAHRLAGEASGPGGAVESIG